MVARANIALFAVDLDADLTARQERARKEILRELGKPHLELDHRRCTTASTRRGLPLQEPLSGVYRQGDAPQ
jgi:hypothetical protein